MYTMIEIIFTKDGSHTLKNLDLNETYHSIHGAVQESLHVFVRHGLEFVREKSLQKISILEIGFGTGLNAWLTARHLQGVDMQVEYETLESFPLKEPVWSKLNYAEEVMDKELFIRLHLADWNSAVQVSENFNLHKKHVSVQEADLPLSKFDLIYFDAFAPEKQPEMWSHVVLQKVVAAMKPGGVFVTYCAKGQVKRDLKNLGLSVEALPGPPGKREMIRAHKS
ncbi:MAG: tRNA (5-methylaminomethyl-2-thiouridine)(34)-methyltransferase MnmD [Cyclobacteriaceae bacterium]|nr:tRNA (5-methylaminomethyl-2-thiouridine)(34)-methyltransferase MnmD [Cyclobacteriaceae bacterium]